MLVVIIQQRVFRLFSEFKAAKLFQPAHTYPSSLQHISHHKHKSQKKEKKEIRTETGEK